MGGKDRVPFEQVRRCFGWCFQEQMMRKKTALAMDSRYVTMIENAFFFVNPPEGSTVKIKERPPLHAFIRKTLYQDLSKPTTDKVSRIQEIRSPRTCPELIIIILQVLRLMRRLNWEDKDLAAYAIKCLTAAWNVKYYNIRCLASLVAGLVEHQVSKKLNLILKINLVLIFRANYLTLLRIVFWCTSPNT